MMKIVANLFVYIIFLFLYSPVLLHAERPLLRSNPGKLILIKKDTAAPNSSKDVVKITRTWLLPLVLTEVSGIDYLDSERIVCVQHEIGSLFIYNLTTSSIETEIPFGPPGDYEAVAIVKNDAYVACSDGRMLEISAFNSPSQAVKEYGTHLTPKQNVEGLSYDSKNNLLLVAIEGAEEGLTNYKGVYAFDLATKKMPVTPVIKIDLLDPAFASIKTKNIQTVIQPSDIAIDGGNGKLYFTDARRNQILITDRSGKIRSLEALPKEMFLQPKGITFSPGGSCYLADAGNKQQPARLMLVEWTNSDNNP